MLPEYSIRKATKQDYQALSFFIGASEYVHRHLDWRASLDWLGYEPYLILQKNEVIQAVLACPPDPFGIAWIRLFSVSSSFIKPFQAWDMLFPEVQLAFEPGFPITFAALGLQDWFINLLSYNNFSPPPGYCCFRMGWKPAGNIFDTPRNDFTPDGLV